jgi:hypothetical protein
MQRNKEKISIKAFIDCVTTTLPALLHTIRANKLSELFNIITTNRFIKLQKLSILSLVVLFMHQLLFLYLRNYLFYIRILWELGLFGSLFILFCYIYRSYYRMPSIYPYLYDIISFFEPFLMWFDSPIREQW